MGVDSHSSQKWVRGIFPGDKGGWCVVLTNLPTSYADCLEIWEPQTSGTLWAWIGLTMNWFNFALDRNSSRKSGQYMLFKFSFPSTRLRFGWGDTCTDGRHFLSLSYLFIVYRCLFLSCVAECDCGCFVLQSPAVVSGLYLSEQWLRSSNYETYNPTIWTKYCLLISALIIYTTGCNPKSQNFAHIMYVYDSYNKHPTNACSSRVVPICYLQWKCTLFYVGYVLNVRVQYIFIENFLWWPRFKTETGHLGLTVGTVALEQIFLLVFR